MALSRTQCFFLELPLEIREKIYKLLLEPDHVRSNIPGYVILKGRPHLTSHFQSPILRTCRQIRVESFQVLYGDHLFMFFPSTGIGTFARGAGSGNLALIKSARLIFFRRDILHTPDRRQALHRNLNLLSGLRRLDTRIFLGHVTEDERRECLLFCEICIRTHPSLSRAFLGDDIHSSTCVLLILASEFYKPSPLVSFGD